MANIGATTAFYKVETSLTRANNEVSKSMERLATGKQNANAGDRSSYVAMADTFRLDFVGTKAGIKGASVVMGYLETGMRVLDSASSLLARMQELAVLGANDTNTTADHEAINLEAEAIADEFNRLMTTSTYKGRDVFVDTASSLYVSMGGRDQEMTFGIGRIDYSTLYKGTAQTIAAATSSSNGPNMGTDFNLAHLPSDAVVIKDTGKATSTGISGRTSGLSAGTSTKTYIITSLDNDSTTHPNGTNYGLGDNVTAGDQALAANPTLKAGETYRITGLNRDTTGATTDLDTADGTHLNATAIGGASTNMVDNAGAAATVLAVGVEFEMTADLAINDSQLEITRLTNNDNDEYYNFAASGTNTGAANEFANLAGISAVYVGDNSDGTALNVSDTSGTSGPAGTIAIGDVIVVDADIATNAMSSDLAFKEVNDTSTRFLAGHEYEIVSLGDSDGAVDVSVFDDAGAIARAVSGIADGDTLVVGQKFTVDEDASVAELAHLNAMTENMTFRMSSDTLTKDIEAMQALLNTARVQAGSQYGALESAVNYTTDLTAQYELGYNTVNDVNFSMETAHLAKNQILQQAATAMLAQANSGQQGLLQLIS